MSINDYKVLQKKLKNDLELLNFKYTILNNKIKFINKKFSCKKFFCCKVKSFLSKLENKKSILDNEKIVIKSLLAVLNNTTYLKDNEKISSPKEWWNKVYEDFLSYLRNFTSIILFLSIGLLLTLPLIDKFEQNNLNIIEKIEFFIGGCIAIIGILGLYANHKFLSKFTKKYNTSFNKLISFFNWFFLIITTIAILIILVIQINSYKKLLNDNTITNSQRRSDTRIRHSQNLSKILDTSIQPTFRQPEIL